MSESEDPNDPAPSVPSASFESLVRTNRRAVVMLGAVLALLVLAWAMGAWSTPAEPLVCEQPHVRLVESLSPELAPETVWEIDVPSDLRATDNPGDELNPDWFVAAPVGADGSIALWSVPFDNLNAVVGEVRSMNEAAVQASNWPRLESEPSREMYESGEIEALLACVGDPPN